MWGFKVSTPSSSGGGLVRGDRSAWRALARRKRNNCHTSTPVDEPLVLLTRDREAQVALSWGLGGWKAAWAADHAMTLPRLSSVRLVQARQNPTLTNF